MFIVEGTVVRIVIGIVVGILVGIVVGIFSILQFTVLSLQKKHSLLFISHKRQFSSQSLEI